MTDTLHNSWVLSGSPGLGHRSNASRAGTQPSAQSATTIWSQGRPCARKKEWPSLGSPVARKSPRPWGPAGSPGARGGPGREAGQGRTSHIRGDVSDFRPQPRPPPPFLKHKVTSENSVSPQRVLSPRLYSSRCRASAATSEISRHTTARA